MSRDRNVVEKVIASLRNIGNFEVSPLRESETGACFKAGDAARRIAVAIRTIWPKDRPNGEEYLQKLLAQARAAQSLEVGNVGKVIGSGELDGGFFIVSSFINGRSLRQHLQNPERLNNWELIDFARQACLGLESAHARGTMHHALHPDNIVLEFDGSTKILDMGLYRANDPATDSFHANAAYLAPEQLAGNGVDRASNFYSIAIMLYEIATGKMPYSGDTWEELAANAQSDFPEPIQLNAAVPPGINAAIMKALSRDRAARFEGGHDLVRALEDYKSFGKPAAPTPPPISVRAVTINAAAAVPAPDPSQSPITPAMVSTQEPVAWKPGAFVPPTPPPPPPPLEEVIPEPPPPPSKAEIAKEAVEKSAQELWVGTRKVAKKVNPWIAALSLLGVVLLLFVGKTIIHSFSSGTQLDESRYAQPAQAPAAAPEPPPTTTEAPATDAATVAAAESAATDTTTTPAATEPPPASTPVTPESRTPRKSKVAARGPAVFNAAHPLPASGFNSAVTGSVMVTTIPASARIVLDGRADKAFNAPQMISSLQPGVHSLTISKDGYTPATRSVQITAGATANLAVQLDLPNAVLAVTSNPTNAYILIDGASTGHVTPSQVAVAPGTHTVTVRKMGYLDSSDSVTVKGGEQQSRSLTLLEAGSTPDIRVVQSGGIHKVFGNKLSGVKISVRTNPPGASVLINGQTVPKTTPVEFGLNPGNYVMEIQLMGYKSLRKTISIEPGKPLIFDETLNE